MRALGTLATHDDAVRFGDYLLTIGLRNHIEPARDGQSYIVWIEHDDHLEQGQLQFRQYQANPNDPRYDEAAVAAKAARKIEQEAETRRRKNYTDVRTSWSGQKMRPTPVSTVLIVICVVVAGLTRVGIGIDGGFDPLADGASAPMPFRVMNALLFQPYAAGMQALAEAMMHGHRSAMTMFSSIAHGQVWRIFTPMFLHFSLLHLLFNLSWLFALGRLIEVRKGPLMFASLVLVSAAVSNCAQALWTVYGYQADGFSSFGGFSGVNYALFGYAWMKGKYQPYELIGVGQQTVGMMLTWLVLCMLGILGPIANAAHVAGLAVGVIAGRWPTLRRQLKISR